MTKSPFFFVNLHLKLRYLYIMEAKKILFITQEMIPYVPESAMATAGRILPQSTQEGGYEIRSFMPRWGNINERRNQLHEVIRLSGMNIIIDDTDHPLIIKVASIQAARMQVYFIDNDDFFHKRLMMCDDKGNEYEDNIERAVFYARGVLETVKKLRWTPDIIYCQGWMSSIAPIYIKAAYNEEPTFANVKVIFSAFDEMPKIQATDRFANCLNFRGANKELLEQHNINLEDPDALAKLAICFSDGYVQGEAGTRPELLDFASSKNIPTMQYPGSEKDIDAYSAFYQSVCSD